MQQLTRIFLFAGLLLLTACGFAAIRGDGDIKTVTRQVPNFTKVYIGGAYQVRIIEGQAKSITIKTDENLLPYVKTYMRDGILHISSEHQSLEPSHNVYVVIKAPMIDAVHLSGANKLYLSTMHLKNLDLQLSGTDTAKVDGIAGNFLVKSSGAAHIDAAKLQAQTASVGIQGSGSVIVNAAKSLTVNIAGSGSVKYYGQPKISQIIHGAGSIRSIN